MKRTLAFTSSNNTKVFSHKDLKSMLIRVNGLGINGGRITDVTIEAKTCCIIYAHYEDIELKILATVLERVKQLEKELEEKNA